MDYDFDLLGDALDRAVDADTVATDVQPEHMGSVVPSLVSPSLHEAFTNWNAQSTSRLDAQVRAMRLLQTGADVSASLMISAGGRREHLARPDLNVAPPMDSVPRRMEWLRKASRESFWTLPPHLSEDLAAVSSTRDEDGGPRYRQRTFKSQRRCRAEKHMCAVEEQMEAQRRAAEADPPSADSVASADAAAGGAGRGKVGDSEGLIQLKALRLRGIQRRLRDAVAQAHPLSGLPGPGVLRFIQREVEVDWKEQIESAPEEWHKQKEEELGRRRAQNRAQYLEQVVLAHDSFRAHHKDRREQMKKLCKDVVKEVQKKERKKQAVVDKEKKDRLAALKSDNISAYRKHIQDSKNERMKMVVSRMDEYMEKLGANINRQTAEAAESVGKDVDQNAATEYTFHLPINEKITEQSSLCGEGNDTLKLKAYQIEGVNWMINLYNNNMSGILADEMGLGKTIQVIGLICHLIEHKNNPGPYLVIAPLSTLSNWESEFERWAPSLNTIVYKGIPGERKALFNEQMKDGKFNVLIVQFELVMNKDDAKRLKTLNWSHVIVDEGHRLKNRESKLFTMLTGKNGYKSQSRVILSGTPLQNEIHELWSLLNFLLPEVFETNDDFEEWFAKPFKTQEDGGGFEVEDEEKEFLIKCLHAVLRPFMTRRLKADLKDIMELPETREATIWCELSAVQRVLYLQTENHLLMQQDTDGGGAKQKKMANRTSQLRKVCNHPFLFKEYNFGDENLIRSCGKFALLDRVLPKLQRGGHRVLVYSQMVQLLHIFEYYCQVKRYHHLKLTGETCSEDRKILVDQWNAHESKYFIFMLSTRAGGQGINLQTADTVIIYDSDWNPMMDEQAKARVHRLGQKKQTLVLRLITPNTVEEKVNKRAQARLQNEDLAIEAGKFNQRTEVAESHEILKQKLAKEFEDKMMQAKDQAHTDDQINELIARTPEEIELFNQIDEEERQAEQKRVRKGAKPQLSRLMTDAEVPIWLQGDPIFAGDRVLCLSDNTSAELVQGEGQMGIVVSVASDTNPLFVVKLEGLREGEMKNFPRAQLRTAHNDSSDQFRQETGYGRGQRQSLEVERSDLVDFSKMTDKQFNKHCRESDKNEDEADAAKKKRKAKRKIKEEGGDGVAVASPASPGGAPASSPDITHSKKRAKVEDVDSINGRCTQSPVTESNGAGGGGRGGSGSKPEDVVEEEDGGGVEEGRHSKYDPGAVAPWAGGAVKPYLYGRKVVFILNGRRLDPLYR